MELEYWVNNALIFSIAPLTYLVYYMYKDKKKLRKEIELLRKILYDNGIWK